MTNQDNTGYKVCIDESLTTGKIYVTVFGLAEGPQETHFNNYEIALSFAQKQSIHHGFYLHNHIKQTIS